jgi:hypothetical protein
MTWEGDGGIVRMRPPVVFAAMDRAGLTGFRLCRFGFFPPFVTNASWGSTLEAQVERFRPLRGIRPFQLFAAVRQP